EPADDARHHKLAVQRLPGNQKLYQRLLPPTIQQTNQILSLAPALFVDPLLLLPSFLTPPHFDKFNTICFKFWKYLNFCCLKTANFQLLGIYDSKTDPFPPRITWIHWGEKDLFTVPPRFYNCFFILQLSQVSY